jgi:bidirectional [NiFe] hydrogenase diaphorase subunit
MSPVHLVIDGKETTIEKGKTVLDAAAALGIKIPTLCHHEKLLPYGACRLCMVEIIRNNKSQMVASCAYPVEEGLEVHTKSPKAIKIRKLMIELLLVMVPYIPQIRQLAEEYGVKKSRFSPKLSMCILCGLCVRYCAEVKKKDAVGFIGRGIDRRLAWIPDSAYQEKCADCFECFTICPTGVFPSNWGIDSLKQLRDS